MSNALKKEATGATEAEKPSMADALGAQAATIAELGPTPVDDGRNASPEPIARSLRASASKDSDLTVVKEILQHALLKTGIRRDPEPIAIDLQERLQQLNINTALQLCHALELAGPSGAQPSRRTGAAAAPRADVLRKERRFCMDSLVRK